MSTPEREGHSPPSASLALQYRAMCMLSDYHAVTLPYCSECRPLGIPTRVNARERGSLTPRRHLPCNIVRCACCLTTTQSRSRTALNAARPAYQCYHPPCNNLQCACRLNTRAATLQHRSQYQYRSKCRPPGRLMPATEREGH